METDKELQAIAKIIKEFEQIDEDRRAFALNYIVNRLKVKGSRNDACQGATVVGELGLDDGTLSSFIQQKQPKNNYQLIACLGYYLEYKKNIKEFGAKEIREANADARRPPISNLTRDIQNTQRQYQLIAPTKNGKKSLTVYGKEVVEMLPDENKVKSLITSVRSRMRKKKDKSDNPKENENK